MLTVWWEGGLKFSCSRSSTAGKKNEKLCTVFSLKQLRLHFKIIAWEVLHGGYEKSSTWGDPSGGNLEAWEGGKTNSQNKYWKRRKEERDFILLHHLMPRAHTGENICVSHRDWFCKQMDWGWKIQIPKRKGQGTTEVYFRHSDITAVADVWFDSLLHFHWFVDGLCKFQICWKFACIILDLL